MKTSHLALVAAVAALALPACPAQARHRHTVRHDTVTPAAQFLRQSGFDLPQERLEPATGFDAARAVLRTTLRHRAAVPLGPSADFWADLPDFSLSYRAGKRGPVIELGAFGFDMRPLSGNGILLEDDSFAHLSLAWNF